MQLEVYARFVKVLRKWILLLYKECLKIETNSVK